MLESDGTSAFRVSCMEHGAVRYLMFSFGLSETNGLSKSIQALPIRLKDS
jgi:hypothetical protein